MKYKNSAQLKLARAIGRSILSMNLHPAFYFAMLIICFMHTTLCFVNQQSQLYKLVKWFDPSLFVPAATFVYMYIGPCLIIACILVVQIIWAFKDGCIQTSTQKHYIIKISTTLAYVMSYTLTLPIIRSSIALINDGYPFNKAIGVVGMLAYLLTIYPYSMFLLTDLSPQNKKIFAYVFFPNCFTVLNVYRPFASIMIATDNFKYCLIPTVLLFILLLFTIFKYPSTTWRYNKVSKAYVACFIWTMLCSFIERSSKQSSPIIIQFYLVGIPPIIFFFAAILRKRILWILTRDTITVLKLKTLYHFLVNLETYDEELDIFIVNHYKICPLQGCPCNKLVAQLRQQKLTNEHHQKMVDEKRRKRRKLKDTLTHRFSLSTMFNMMKSGKKQTKSTPKIQEGDVDQGSHTQQFKAKQMKLWFQLLHDLQNSEFRLQKLKSLSSTEKDLQLRKARQIILDQVEVLRECLDKQYQSLRHLLYAQQIHQNLINKLLFYVRFCIQQSRQDHTIKVKSTQEGSNQYALKFNQLQIKLLSFRGLLLKAVVKCEKFWNQLGSKVPDQKKIITQIQDLQNFQKDIVDYVKVNRKKKELASRSNSDYEVNWQQKISYIIQDVYAPFEQAFLFGKKSKQNLPDSLTINRKQPSNILQKNLLFYDCNSKTGMGIVNIEESDSFGSISQTNKQFWSILNCARYEKVKINHFLVKEMHQYHDGVMINFLYENKHFLNFHRGFACDGMKNIIQIEFTVEILPHIYEGLCAAVFLQQIKTTKAIFLTNKSSNILAYNCQFKQKFLKDFNVQQFDEIINKDVIQKLQDEQKCTIEINGDEYQVQKIHSIENQNRDDDLYFCEISYEWDQIPKKNSLMEDETRSNFYGKNSDQIDQRFTAPTSVIEKITQKKQELQPLIKIINSERRSKKLERWKIFIRVALFVMCLIGILCAGLTQLRVSKYANAYQILSILTNYIQDLVQSPYIARKINILSFNNQTSGIEIYFSTLQNLKENLINYRTQLNIGMWPQSLDSYDLSQDDKVIVGNTTYEMIIQKYILSAYTSIMENPTSQNFDYVKAQNPLPYNPVFLSFMSTIYNTYYGVVNVTATDFRNYLADKLLSQVNTIKAAPIIIMLIINAFLCGVMTFITAYYRGKLLKLFWISFKFLEKVHIYRIDERAQSLKNYKEANLADLLEERKCASDNIFNSNGEKKTQKLPGSLLNQVSRNYSIQNLEQTSRDFQTGRQSAREKQNLTSDAQKKKRNKLKVIQKSKFRPIVVSIIGIIPILVISLVIMFLQLSSNSFIQSFLDLRQYYNERTEFIRIIKSYTFEIGYQTDNFKSQSVSITQQMPIVLQNIYQVMRMIQQNQSIQGSNLNNKISYLQSRPLCDIQIYLKNLNYASTPCNVNETSAYGNKLWNEVLVDYIETARSLASVYSGHLNTTQQRQFMADSNHLKLQRQSQQLLSIQYYLTDISLIQFQSRIKTYQITIVSLSLTLIVVIGFVLLKWATIEMNRMALEVNRIKTLLKLVFSTDINTNQELKQEVLANQSAFKILI